MTKRLLYLYSTPALIILMLLQGSLFSQTIAINEVMASNATRIADEDGDYEDWIELYNYGSTPINLIGYGLSDDYVLPFKWKPYLKKIAMPLYTSY
jgi:hypothetical protein